MVRVIRIVVISREDVICRVLADDVSSSDVNPVHIVFPGFAA